MSSDELMGLKSTVVVDKRQAQLYGDASEYLIKKSCQVISPQMFAHQTCNNSQLQFQIQIPSKSCLIDRRVVVRSSFLLTFTAAPGAGNRIIPVQSNAPGFTSADGAFFDPTSFGAARSNPLSACSQNLTVFINGVAISNQLSDWSQLFSLGLYSQELAKQYTGAFSYGDKSQQYGGDSGQTATGSSINPFNDYNDSTGYTTFRGDNTYEIVSNPAAVGSESITATMRFISYEPLMSAPFLGLKRDDSKALGGINLLQINYSLSGFNLQKAFSLNPLGAQSGILSAFNVTLERGDVLMTIITPSPILGPLPSSLFYDCETWNNFKSNQTTAYAPSVANPAVTVQNVQLPCIPSKMLVFVSKSDSNFTAYDSTSEATLLLSAACNTDCLAYIKQIDLQFNNITGIWSAASDDGYQLWQAAYRNGLEMSWPDWKKHRGSIAIFDFSKDVPSDALSAIGVAGQYNLSFRITFMNPNDTVVPGTNPAVNTPSYYYTVNYCMIYDSVLEITPSFSRLSNGFDRSVVLQDINQGNVDVNVNFGYAPDLVGGAWWNNLSDLKNSIVSNLRTIYKALPEARNLYDKFDAITPQKLDNIVHKGFDIAQFLIPKLIGNGMSKKKIHEMFKGQIDHQMLEELLNNAMRGSALRGGKKIKSSRLSHY